MLVHVGLANKGVKALEKKFERIYDELEPKMKIFASIALTNEFGKMPTIPQATADYLASFETLKDKVSAIEVNISCPNAMVGEIFLDPKNLEVLLTEIDNIEKHIPITLKMPSFLEEKDFGKLCDVAQKHNVQTLTIANLRKDRTGLNIPEDWKGNVSGLPTAEKSTKLIRFVRREFQNRFAIIGVGGINSAFSAYKRIKAGANLIALASSLIYKGPFISAEINRGLVKLLKEDGIKSIKDAVGVEAF
jgi:dihydroorotate dehydrogenase (fumarate)